MTDIVIRDTLVRALTVPLEPQGFRIEPFQRIPDKISRPTAILKQEAIGRAVEAGKVIPGGRVARFTLTLAVQYELLPKAEDALDDFVIDLLNAIDGIDNVRWTTAEKRILSEQTNAPCYDVDLEFVFQHTRPPK